MLRRKLKELLIAIELERHYTKREILELYLNKVYSAMGCTGPKRRRPATSASARRNSRSRKPRFCSSLASPLCLRSRRAPREGPRPAQSGAATMVRYGGDFGVVQHGRLGR